MYCEVISIAHGSSGANQTSNVHGQEKLR